MFIAALTLAALAQGAPTPGSVQDASPAGKREATLEAERAEEVASEVGRIIEALDARFVEGEDPFAGEPANRFFGDDASTPLEDEPANEPAAGFRAGGPNAPVEVARFPARPGDNALRVDAESGPEDALDAARARYEAIEAALGGRPSRATEVKAKAVTRVRSEGPDTWDVRFRVRHARVDPVGAAASTTSIWTLRVSFAGEVPSLVCWAGGITERVRRDAPTEGLAGFVDVTASVLTGERAAWLSPSIMDLRDALDVDVGVGILGHHGVAVADVNGDGIEDMYLCQPGGVPNQLWLRRPDGTAIEAAAAAGLDLVDATTSALFVDLDADGDRDVVLGLASGVLVLARTNDSYREVQRVDRTGITSLAAADVDGDGRIDLYACAYANPYDGSTFPVPYHDAENGQENLLLANVTLAADALRFEDATARSGLKKAAARFSFAATFEDFDDDGDVDLYVANDFGRNALYENDGTGWFENRAAGLGVEDVAAGMGASFADLDGDGQVDLYVANMESSAGRRVTGQETFGPGADDATRALLRRHAKGNTLFLRTPDGGFRETGLATAGQWAWGAIPIDLDGDGALDLYVPNGFVTGTDEEAPDL
ncbi:MAG: VCBS repeat-containing protein [Planctomycetota bacterium]